MLVLDATGDWPKEWKGGGFDRSAQNKTGTVRHRIKTTHDECGVDELLPATGGSQELILDT